MKVRLGDYIEQIRGVSYKPSDLEKSLSTNSIPLFRANNIQEDGLNFDNLVYVLRKRVSQQQIVKKGDIVICTSSGSKHLVGKAAQSLNNIEITFGAFCKVIRTDNIYYKYLGHYFNSLYYRREISNLAAGANINNIRNEHIDELMIELPSIEEQKRISEKLDKVSYIISLRKKQIYKLELLIKSQFVEMFGDPVNNPLDWPKKEFSKGISELKYGTSQPPVFVNKGIPFIRATNIKNGRITTNEMLYISEDEASLIKKCKLREGDIIIVRSGANTGDSTFISKEYEGAYGGYDIIIRLNEELNWYYVITLLNSRYRDINVNPLTRRAGQPHLNAQQINGLKICYPPTKLQNQFANFVKQIDKQKFGLQKSLNELDTLYNALMQKYFG